MWPWRKPIPDVEAKSLQALEEFFAAAGATSSAIAVTPSKALECAPVARGVSVRSETLGILPCHLYRRLEGGGKERADHPLEALLSGRPNGWTSTPHFLMELERDSLLHDAGAFALAKRARESEARRPSASARGYTSAWSTASKAFLAMPGHERCACGCGRPADMVDHICAPKGNRALFWDRSNWQPFARVCNTRKAIATEGGFGKPIAGQTPGRVQTFAKGLPTAWGPQRKVAPNSVSGKIDP